MPAQVLKRGYRDKGQAYADCRIPGNLNRRILERLIFFSACVEIAVAHNVSDVGVVGKRLVEAEFVVDPESDEEGDDHAS
jgi:hypothetical protein